MTNCRAPWLRPDAREDFAWLHLHGMEAPLPPAHMVVSGFFKRWVNKYAERADIAEMFRLSHQIVVVDFQSDERGDITSICNQLPSHIAIIQPDGVI